MFFLPFSPTYKTNTHTHTHIQSIWLTIEWKSTLKVRKAKILEGGRKNCKLIQFSILLLAGENSLVRICFVFYFVFGSTVPVFVYFLAWTKTANRGRFSSFSRSSRDTKRLQISPVILTKGKESNQISRQCALKGSSYATYRKVGPDFHLKRTRRESVMRELSKKKKTWDTVNVKFLSTVRPSSGARALCKRYSNFEEEYFYNANPPSKFAARANKNKHTNQQTEQHKTQNPIPKTNTQTNKPRDTSI